MARFASSCCAENCNSPNGECGASADYLSVHCHCTFFYTGSTCAEYSTEFVVLISVFSAVLVIVFIVVWYRQSKWRFLEYLRSGVLSGNQEDKHMRKLREELILNDILVKYEVSTSTVLVQY